MTDWKIGPRVEPVAAAVEPKAQSPEPSRRWALFNVERYRERDVELRINDMGYSAYVPRFKTTIRDKSKHRKRVEVMQPLFAGYLFGRFSPDDPWGALKCVRGVLGIMCVGEQPVFAPDRVVAELQAAESDGFVDQRFGKARNRAEEFQAGEKLKVTDGPFAGKIARFVSVLPNLDGRGRIEALLDLFGRVVKTELHADQVERAG